MKIRMLKKLRIVMISESEYNSMQETLRLLGSAKNAERLREPIAEFKAANPKKTRPKPGSMFPRPDLNRTRSPATNTETHAANSERSTNGRIPPCL
jgi:hypothetical protein